MARKSRRAKLKDDGPSRKNSEKKNDDNNDDEQRAMKEDSNDDSNKKVAKKPPPAAAAAAKKGGDDDVDIEQDATVKSLIEHVKSFFTDNDTADAHIDEEQARHLLEVSGGDVEVAGGLYWDDYFARQNGQNQNVSRDDDNNDNEEEEQDPPLNENRGVARARENESDEDDIDDCDLRRVRRRLAHQFAAAGGDELDDIDMHPPSDREDNDDDEEVDEPADVAAAIPDGEDDDHPDRDNVGGSVNISDDEAGGVWRMARHFDDENDDIDMNQRPSRAVRRESVQGRNVSDAASNADSPMQARPTRSVDSNENDEGYLSDNDWILYGAVSNLVSSPSKILWNGGKKKTTDENDEIKESNEEEEEEEDEDEADPKSYIPSTWFQTGFSMASCGSGLVTKAPTDDDVSVFRWRQASENNGSSSRHVVLPPFHCRGVTALLSVVTALIYTGTTIQGDKVSCSASRKSFTELSEEERVREFDSRLVDALAVLLHIAITASTDRKKPSLLSMPSDGDKERSKQQLFRRRLRLCPTCRWEDESKLPEGPDAGKKVQVQTSFTSIHDIKTYVKSNMRSFTGRGGCALFLETVVRIHGNGAIARMVKLARRSASLPPADSDSSLIQCSCEHHSPKRPGPSSQPKTILDTSPRVHTCLTTELLSLLLTGKVHSTMQGWSTGRLGFGIISMSNAVDRNLLRPEKPVWVLQGETNYSVVWSDRAEGADANIAMIDKPGSSFPLVHWTCWYNVQNRTGMRMITAKKPWCPPVVSKVSVEDFSKKQSVLESLLDRRKQNIVSSDEQDDEHKTFSLPVTEEELDRIRYHADDEKFYPKQYHLWRYDLGPEHDDDEDRKLPANGFEEHHWTPYHLLSRRQKVVVDMKLAPKICRILWKRWPEATIDSFTPASSDSPDV